MKLATSRITAQGQISIPVSVRKKLGVTAGCVLEWHQTDNSVVVCKSGSYNIDDLRSAVFPEGRPARKSIEEMDEAIAQHLREKHARR